MKEFKIKRYDREQLEKQKQNIRATVLTLILGVTALVVGWCVYPPVYQLVTSWEPPSLQPREPVTEQPSEPEPPPSQPEEPPQEEQPETGVFPAAAVYLPPALMDDDEQLAGELRSLREKGVTGVIFDLKDALGVVQYQSKLDIVANNHAQREGAWSLTEKTALIRRAGLVPVGRLYAFRDRTSTARMYESAVKYMNSTVNWIDDSLANGGKPWLNPNNQAAQDYIIALVEEAAASGVGTILLDGVQFPDGVALDLATYGNTGPLDKSAVLASFLTRVRTAGESRGSQVAVTVNLISAAGLSTTRYGEDVGRLLTAAGYGVVEVMPEQFGNGVTSEGLTLSSPALDPYKTVSEAIQASEGALFREGVELAAVVQAYTSTRLSPSANKSYGPQEIRDQVRAAQEAGIQAVIYLNPEGDYANLAR